MLATIRYQGNRDRNHKLWNNASTEIYILHMKKSLKIQKGVIRICISKKNRQHNGQKKKYKKTNNDLQKLNIKLKIANTNPTKNRV